MLRVHASCTSSVAHGPRDSINTTNLQVQHDILLSTTSSYATKNRAKTRNVNKHSVKMKTCREKPHFDFPTKIVIVAVASYYRQYKRKP